MKGPLSDYEMNIANRVSRFFHTLFSNFQNFLMNLKSTFVQDNYLKILLLLTITGLILRLRYIGDTSLWLDEVFTNNFSRQSLLEILSMKQDAFHPPTFYLIEHVMLYFGSGEAVLRLVPALAGICTIPVFYLLGKEFHNRETGLVAAALLTVSTFHISYSQEARSYTLFLLCFSLALLFYLRALRTNARNEWLLFGVLSAVSCWVYLFGFVMIVPLFILAIIIKSLPWESGSKNLKPVIMAGVICFLLALPMMLAAVRAGLSNENQAGSWGDQGIDVITSTIHAELGSDWVMIILLLSFLLGLVSLYRDDRKLFFFILVALVLPLVTMVVLSYRMPIVPRYLIGLLPFFYLGISYFICSVQLRLFTIRFSCIAILLLFAISVPSLIPYTPGDSKMGQDWKGFSQELHNLTGAGDQILVYPGYNTVSLTYYYHNGTEQTRIYGIENKKDLDTFLIQNPDQKTMVIIVGSNNLKPAGEISPWINAHAVLAEKHGELFLYKIINPDNMAESK